MPNTPTVETLPEPFAKRTEFDNLIGVYAASMGKLFRVLCIARSDHEANEFCRKNPDCGVIAGTPNGQVLCAELYGSVCPSAVLEDLKRR